MDSTDSKAWRLSEVTGEYLPGDRYGHGAVTLENGQILVIGGKTRYRHLILSFKKLLSIYNLYTKATNYLLKMKYRIVVI